MTVKIALCTHLSGFSLHRIHTSMSVRLDGVFCVALRCDSYKTELSLTTATSGNNEVAANPLEKIAANAECRHRQQSVL